MPKLPNKIYEEGESIRFYDVDDENKIKNGIVYGIIHDGLEIEYMIVYRNELLVAHEQDVIFKNKGENEQ